jgi:hypothetical protein
MISIKELLRRLRYEQGISLTSEQVEIVQLGLSEVAKIANKADETILNELFRTLQDSSLSGKQAFTAEEMSLIKQKRLQEIAFPIEDAGDRLTVKFTSGEQLEFSNRPPTNGELRGTILKQLIASQISKDSTQTLLQIIARTEREPATSSFMRYALGALGEPEIKEKIFHVLSTKYTWYNRILFPIYDAVNSVFSWIKNLFTSSNHPSHGTAPARRSAVPPRTSDIPTVSIGQDEPTPPYIHPTSPTEVSPPEQTPEKTPQPPRQ